MGTATYFAIKAGKEHSDQLKRQRASMDEYGANISQNSQKAIGSFNELHQKAALAAAAAPVVLGVAAVGTATYFAIKAGKEHSDQLKRQRASMDEYGANISQNSQKAIGSFNELHQKAKNDMALLDTAVGKQSKQLSSDVVSKYSKMADMVEQQFSKTKKAGLDALSDLSGSFGSAGNSWIVQVQKGVDKRADGL
ncbi:hypothetical protein WP50_27065 [Lactiplantibacillus plantarum]|nr:hypothetical protein WP50_27065 [Lactiplantibacillus plantarum]